MSVFEEEGLGGSKSLGETEATGFTTCPVILLTRPPLTPTKRTGNNSESCHRKSTIFKWHSFSASINQNQLLGNFSRWIGGAWIRLDGGHDQPPSLVATGHQVAPAWRETNLPQYNQLYHVSENTKYKIQNTKTNLPQYNQLQHVSENTKYKIQRPPSLYTHRSTMCQRIQNTKTDLIYKHRSTTLCMCQNSL